MPQNDVIDSSVQKRGKDAQSAVFMMAYNYDLMPSWWAPDRDSYFRSYWTQENFLSSSVYAIANRNAAFGWELTGVNSDSIAAQQLLQFAEFGQGWQQFIEKLSIDLLTQDNGAFIEVIRPAKVKINGKTLPAVKQLYENNVPAWFAFDGSHRYKLKDASAIYDSPLDLPIGIAHLDAGQCQRTGDPEFPIIYTDRDGKRHRLTWWQVLPFNDMPSPIEKMNGVGYSALTRCFRASHIMQSISIYNDEKIGGRFNKAIFLTNIDPDSINDAIIQSKQDADNAGLIRYSQPIVAATLNPESPVSLETINLAEIPDGFDQNTQYNWYIAALALAFGVDYGFLAPLPGKGLGTASQSETMERQSRGKSSRLFMDMVSNAFNFKGILPETVQFRFTEIDKEEEKADEATRKARADRYQIYAENGWITPTVAQQMLVDNGDIAQQYLEQMGQEDTTPVSTTSGDENIDTQIEQQAEVDAIEKFYKAIKQRQELLFKKPSLVKRLKNATEKIFKTKQIEVPEVDDSDLQNALNEYSEEIEALAMQAKNGEIEKGQFIELLSDLVTSSLAAIYAEMVGKEPSEFSEQDTANLEEYVNVNLESVNKLSDDIYSGAYNDTEEQDGTIILLGRLGLWVLNASALATLGMLSNPKLQENKLQWNLGIAEHCDTCLALNGQIHTVSEWNDSGFYPRFFQYFLNFSSVSSSFSDEHKE